MPSFSSSEEHHKILSVLRESLKNKVTDPRAQIRLYNGIFHALNECLVGLLALYPHRNEIICRKGQSPYFHPILKLASKNGVSVKFAEFGQSALPLINDQTLLILTAEDDPFTGELNDNQELEKTADEKKVYVLEISTQSFRRRENFDPKSKHHIHVFCPDNRFAIKILGARAKYEALLFGADRTTATVEEILNCLDPVREDRTAVEKFENPFKDSKFSSARARLWDRALLAFENVNGEGLLGVLGKLNDEGFQTTSLCRWNDEKSLQYLVDQGRSWEFVNSLISISLDSLNSGLSDDIEKARAEVLDLAK